MSTLSVRAKLGVFAVSLIVLIGQAVLFGSGILRFGLEGPFVYVIYIIAGCWSPSPVLAYWTAAESLLESRSIRT